MDGLSCREYRPEEAAEACAFTERIFGPLPLEDWVGEPNLTASMAFLDEELVGVIPLSLRSFKLAPDIVCTSAWENAVGTREDLRGRGIGTAMIAAAREFLADRTDLLCVYRGAERSDGYRFYADKTGHVDLCYIPFYRLNEPGNRRPDGYSIHPHQEVFARAEEMAALHHSHWGQYGGHVVRDAETYRYLIDCAIYGRVPATRTLHRIEVGGVTAGFAVTGIRQGKRADGTCMIMDFAVADGAPSLAARLLDGVESYAHGEGCPLVWPSSMRTPLVPLMLERGFERGPRRMEIMAIPVRPVNLFAKLAAARGGCEVTVDVWTPTVDYRLHDAGETAPRCTLELKDRELCLFLASRLDGRTALEEERLTITGPAPLDKVEQTIARLGRCMPWVHHYLDWL